MLRHCHFCQLHPFGITHTKNEGPFPPATLQNALGQKASPSLPDRSDGSGWAVCELSFSCPEQSCLHQFTIYHRRLIKVSAGTNTRGCYPGTASAQPRRILTGWRWLWKGHLTPSALERPQGQPLHTGTTSPHRDNTLGARKDLMSLSSLFPHQFLLVNILCSQNTVSNIEPKSFSAMGLLFPVSHHCSSDHSMSCGCSALHSFLPRIVLNSRSFW